MKPNDVVAAIIKKDGLYLIAQRNRHKYMGLRWEFPGGKVESDETFHEALSREIQEELNTPQVPAKVAILAAMNIADEFFAIKRDNDKMKNTLEGKVSSLMEVVEEEIQKQ